MIKPFDDIANTKYIRVEARRGHLTVPLAAKDKDRAGSTRGTARLLYCEKHASQP
jgi:hypothetical protein